MAIEASEKAGQRTKSRIREHTLIPGRWAPSVTALGFRPGIMFTCSDDNCEWAGWLAEEEVIIT